MDGQLLKLTTHIHLPKNITILRNILNQNIYLDF